LLKRRTDAAQTDVSKLAKMFKMMFLPTKSWRPASDRSVLTSLIEGASMPTAGRHPAVWTGLPWRVISAIFVPPGSVLDKLNYELNNIFFLFAVK
jgi:hypothetical protein